MPEGIPGFFEWVATTRRVTDTPRGDFVNDTRSTWNVFKNEEKCERHFNSNAIFGAREEYEKLRRQYNREFGI